MTGLAAGAQTNFFEPSSNDVAAARQIEKVREDCIGNRRMISGKILQIQADGLVIDSGYTNLDRYPLNRSWLAPGTAIANRATNVIEGKQPDSICMGVVFIADLPPVFGRTPKLYDYVHLEGFPAGQYTYTSVGDVHRSIRKFSAKLPKAIEWQLNAEKK
ncbi:MAG TPA: hypothetical protein VG938_13000 [Verrucomicrobiae bacterium]|nr:hypothetical protein [Verrucomicrobiae bacterium]